MTLARFGWSLGTTLVLALPALGFARQEVSTPEDVFVTIRREGPALVREMRQVLLAKGLNRVRATGFSPRIDPLSLQVRPVANAPVQLLQHSLWFQALNRDAVLGALFGEEIRIKRVKDQQVPEEFTGTILFPPYTQTPTGRKKVPVFMETTDGTCREVPDGDLILRRFPKGDWNTLWSDWQVECGRPGSYRLEMIYQTEGLSFAPQYTVHLRRDAAEVNFSGVASITNKAGLTLSDARVVLEDRGLFSRRYPLARRLALPEERTLTVALVDARGLTGTRTATVMWPEGDAPAKKPHRLPVVSRLDLPNTEIAGLGLDLPQGPLRVVWLDEEGRPFEGPSGGEVTATATGGVLSLAVEVLEGLVARRTIQTISYTSRRVEVVVFNSRPEPVTVEILHRLEIGEAIADSSSPMTLRSPELAVGTVEVSAGAPAKLNYTVSQH